MQGVSNPEQPWELQLTFQEWSHCLAWEWWSAKITAQAPPARGVDQEQQGPGWPNLFKSLLAKLTLTKMLRSRRSIFLTESHADVAAGREK